MNVFCLDGPLKGKWFTTEKRNFVAMYPPKRENYFQVPTGPPTRLDPIETIEYRVERLYDKYRFWEVEFPLVATCQRMEQPPDEVRYLPVILKRARRPDFLNDFREWLFHVIAELDPTSYGAYIARKELRTLQSKYPNHKANNAQRYL